MLQLRIENIKHETADAATFVLSEISGKTVPYQAGQFITLVFNHHDDEIRRSYSLSSSPHENNLAITVKRVTNGEISRFILAKVKKGDVLNAVPPAGRFILGQTAQTQLLVYFAAGSGIVPVFSHIKYLLSESGAGKIVLFYSSNTSSDILFNNELTALQAANPQRLNIIYLISDKGERLTNINLEALVNKHIGPNLSTALFYICGPFAYMRMVRLSLLVAGINATKIRKENFVVETITVANNATVYAPQNIRLDFNGETYNISVGENQSVLQAALQNNIKLPYSCRGGMCSSCMAKCVSGAVEMSVNDVLTDNDLAEGWVLTCTSHPVTDNVGLKVS